MRNITDYGEEYKKESFEIYQVKYRRKMLLERIKFWTDHMGGNPLAVLEVGIGLEPLVQFVDVFKEWICIEPVSDFVEHAKQVCPANVTIVQGFIEDCAGKLHGRHFDLIIISGLLHEVEDPSSLLYAIRNIADEETVIHINVPNADSVHRILAVESGLAASVTDLSDRNRLLQQHHVFSMESLENLIKTTGEVHVEERGSYFVKPFSHGQMREMMKYGIISEKILDGLYSLGRYFPKNGSEIFIEFRADF